MRWAASPPPHTLPPAPLTHTVVRCRYAGGKRASPDGNVCYDYAFHDSGTWGGWCARAGLGSRSLGCHAREPLSGRPLHVQCTSGWGTPRWCKWSCGAPGTTQPSSIASLHGPTLRRRVVHDALRAGAAYLSALTFGVPPSSLVCACAHATHQFRKTKAGMQRADPQVRCLPPALPPVRRAAHASPGSVLMPSPPSRTCCMQDEGPGYRNVIGLPGGVNSPLFEVLKASAPHW